MNAILQQTYYKLEAYGETKVLQIRKDIRLRDPPILGCVLIIDHYIQCFVIESISLDIHTGIYCLSHNITNWRYSDPTKTEEIYKISEEAKKEGWRVTFIIEETFDGKKRRQ